MIRVENTITDSFAALTVQKGESHRKDEQARRELARQRAYVVWRAKIGGKHQLVMPDTFLRGIRDLGYRSTATALDELNDNSYQAGAEHLHHVFGYSDGTTYRPGKMAIIDDGHGMEPAMIRLAVMWGGTHREDSREGFGRYGYGLPSACMSQATRFSVYSAVEGSELHKVTVDLDEITHRFASHSRQSMIENAKPAELPSWVDSYIRRQIAAENLHGTNNGQLIHGTVVVVENLDRLTWKTAITLKRELLQHFGLIYRNYLADMTVFVEEERVNPIDPLFITRGAHLYDWDSDRAIAYKPVEIMVRNETGTVHLIKVRYSYLPPTFARIDKTRDASRRARNANPRWDVMDAHKGIVVCRSGRQVGVVTRCPWTVLRNNDRYWKAEVDFPPGLDEEFALTTSKQQVLISDQMWDILKDNGIWTTIERMRKRYDAERSRAESQGQHAEDKRRSEAALEAVNKHKNESFALRGASNKREKQWLVDQVAREHFETGRPLEVVLDGVRKRAEKRARDRPYQVIREHAPGGPFYRADLVGGQRFLYLNTAHRFFTVVYDTPETSSHVQDALEILLFSLADYELDQGHPLDSWETRCLKWSMFLDDALAELPHIDRSLSGSDCEREDVSGVESATCV